MINKSDKILSDDILCEKVEKIITRLVKALEDKQLSYFQNKPTGEISHKKDDIMVSLIDDNNQKVQCLLNQDPRRGKKYIFLNKNNLLENQIDIYEIIGHQITYIEDEIRGDTAYNENLKRVNRLMRDENYAIAIVFIVSAFESAVSDLFFKYQFLWFIEEILNATIRIPDDEIFLEYGERYNDSQLIGYSAMTDINDVVWGILPYNWEFAKKLRYLKVREHVFKTCDALKILEDYIKKLRANKFNEIGHFDILKNILFDSKKTFRGINFQALSGSNNVKFAYKQFYDIELDDLKDECKKFEDILLKRHKIIHGSLKGNEVNEVDVREALDILRKIIEFIKSKISQLAAEYNYHNNPSFIF